MTTDEVFALKSKDMTGEYVMEWMMEMEFSGPDIARVMRALKPEVFPSLFLDVPGDDDIEAAVDTVLGEASRLSRLSGLSRDVIEEIMLTYREGTDGAVDALCAALNEACESYGLKPAFHPWRKPSACEELAEEVPIGDDVADPVRDAQEAKQLFTTAYAISDSMRVIDVTILPADMPSPGAFVAAIAGGLAAVASTKPLALMAAKTCAILGRYHPSVAPFVWFVDEEGRWWPPDNLHAWLPCGRVPQCDRNSEDPRRVPPRRSRIVGRLKRPGGEEWRDFQLSGVPAHKVAA